MGSEVQLAIVIPAYKAEYLAEALESLCAQTDKRFRVHIGDDASPGPIREICDRYRHELDLNYHRFDENLGGESLVAQWHRCIRLSSDPWIWLFSDDDIMEPSCVESFYVALEQTESKFDLYRFNTLKINAKGKVIQVCHQHPLVETGLEFAYHRLRNNRPSFVSEYIFSRKTFNENGGMVEFPLAWCSDDASWIAFGGEKGIFTIYGPKVHWRRSSINISFSGSPDKDKKVEACLLFLEWLRNRYDIEKVASQLQIDYSHFSECCESWLHYQLSTLAPLGPSTWKKLSADPRILFFGGSIKIFATMVGIDLGFVRRYVFSILGRIFNKN